jgi:hypothetical protein
VEISSRPRNYTQPHETSLLFPSDEKTGILLSEVSAGSVATLLRHRHVTDAKAPAFSKKALRP